MWRRYPENVSFFNLHISSFQLSWKLRLLTFHTCHVLWPFLLIVWHRLFRLLTDNWKSDESHMSFLTSMGRRSKRPIWPLSLRRPTILGVQVLTQDGQWTSGCTLWPLGFIFCFCVCGPKIAVHRMTKSWPLNDDKTNEWLYMSRKTKKA